MFAVLLSLAFIAQLGSIFTAIEVRNKLAFEPSPDGFSTVLQKYNEDSSIKSEWDSLQMDMRCCGGIGQLDGYQIYSNVDGLGTQNNVPDSCCRTVQEGCGKGLFSKQTDEKNRVIWTTGCYTALKYRLDNDVKTIMAVYAGVGVLIALIELIAVVLTCAYVAQITRRLAREELMWNATHHHSDEMDHLNAAKALNGERTSANETPI